MRKSLIKKCDPYDYYLQEKILKIKCDSKGLRLFIIVCESFNLIFIFFVFREIVFNELRKLL